jgi:hypothetical protein
MTMITFSKRNLLAAIFMTGALVASGSASAAVSCSTVGTVSAWLGLGSAGCTDPDGDVLMVATGTTGDVLALNPSFSVDEFETAEIDNYNVVFSWHPGYLGSGSITYTMTHNPGVQEAFNSTAMDTTVALSGSTLAIKTVDTSGGSLLGTATSTNGSNSGQVSFTPTGNIQVTDSFNASAGSGDIFSAANSFVAAPIPEPEIFAMMLPGLGLMGFVANRRRKRAA